MSFSNPRTPKNCPAQLDDYLNCQTSATPSSAALLERLQDSVARSGTLSFPEFLEIVLYDATHGYYARRGDQVGRKGDFYTSVSVGSLFGKLLARRFTNWWEENGRPKKWRIVEFGGHDGKLAADVLKTLQTQHQEAFTGLNYIIPEPLPKLRKLQSEHLTGYPDHFTSIDHTALGEISPLPGIVFANEILDALPFHLIKRQKNHWVELHVDKNLQFKETAICPESHLSAQIKNLPENLAEGYQTEVRTCFHQFLKTASATISTGLLLFIDYGFATPEYYDVHRSTGTLRTFKNHQAGEEPLTEIGEKDITAHVDFTDLARSGIQLGYHPTAFSSQGSFLTHLATNLIKDGALNDPKQIRQFQSLTHPGHLGASFHVIELTKNGAISSQVKHRLAL